MKKNSCFFKFLSLMLCFTSFVLIFSACEKKGEDTGKTTDEDEGLVFETPEVSLSGVSPVSLLDKGDKAAVKIGPFEISAEFIMTNLKKTVLDRGMKQSPKTAALRLAAIYYKERALAGTELELTEEYVKQIMKDQIEDFKSDEEANLYNCESLGLSKEEYMDFVTISEVEAFLDARYLEEIYDNIEQTYEKKYGKEGSAAEISEYYPNFMIAVVRGLEFEEVSKNALSKIEKDFEEWIVKYIDSGENLS